MWQRIGSGRKAFRILGALALVALSSGPANAATTYAYPLKASANGRYFVDQNGTPFRMQGEAAWSLISNMTYADANAYLDNRAAKGFNTVLVNLIEHQFAVNAPANRALQQPFTTPGNFATPNPAYFAFADSIIDLAASKGIVVLLDYMFLGFGGGDEGWWQELTSGPNNQTVCRSFGEYLGNRYKNKKNILWLVGGDYTPPPGSEGEARLHKILEGIQSAGATQPHMGDWASPSLSTDVAAFAADMDANAVYTYGYGSPRNGRTYVLARDGFLRAPTIPAFLLETGYELEDNNQPGDRASIRKYQYWAVLGGTTTGMIYGHRDIWEFATATWSSGFYPDWDPWPQSLESPGALDTMRMGQLLDSVPWFDLVPSGLAGMKTLVTAGGGTFDGAQGDAYVTAAATANGRALVAYLPPTGTAPRSITVDRTAMSHLFRARWFNPTTGAFTLISSSLPNTGTQVFTTPGTNGSGTNDWVLVLDALTPPIAFYTVPPCRTLDTRNPVGARGGPALAANATRSFPVAGLCGVPNDPAVRAVAVNVTVVGATAAGNLRLFANGTALPLASVINFATPRARANNAVIPLGPNGRMDVRCDMAAAGATHFLLDVVGYMR
jgi:hypothetical protein